MHRIGIYPAYLVHPVKTIWQVPTQHAECAIFSQPMFENATT